MDRFVLSDDQWSTMEPHCRASRPILGVAAAITEFFGGGAVDCGDGQSVARSAGDCSAGGTPSSSATVTGRKPTFQAAVSDEPDMEFAMVGGTSSRSTATAGAKGGLIARP